MAIHPSLWQKHSEKVYMRLFEQDQQANIEGDNQIVIHALKGNSSMP